MQTPSIRFSVQQILSAAAFGETKLCTIRNLTQIGWTLNSALILLLVELTSRLQFWYPNYAQLCLKFWIFMIQIRRIWNMNIKLIFWDFLEKTGHPGWLLRSEICCVLFTYTIQDFYRVPDKKCWRWQNSNKKVKTSHILCDTNFLSLFW